MEKSSGDQYWDIQQNNLIKELMVGKEWARQLQILLNAPSSSHETRELLVHEILNSYDKALYLLNKAAANIGANNIIAAEATTTSNGGVLTIGMSESPRSLSCSPCSEDSDREFKVDIHQEHPSTETSTTPRKRNAMPRWTKHVQVSQGSGLEGPLDDGYGWRKYGQKDILGARYPRGYYRCTHRRVQGCLATKQVQRSDDDPTIFEITYRGRHSCSQQRGAVSHDQPKPPNSPIILPENPNILPPPQQYQQQILLSFQTGLKVMTQNLPDSHHHSFSSLNFPSTASTSTYNAENYGPFPSVIHHHFPPPNSSPSFEPPAAASPSNFYGLNNSFAGASESQLPGLISAAPSSTNSSTVGLDAPFGQMEFESNFTFSNPGFFS